MKRLVWFGVILLAGCATVQPPANTPPPLPLLATPAIEEAPMPALPVDERAFLMDSEPSWIEGNPLAITAKAVKRATMTASSAGFHQGMLVYPYTPYRVYRADVPFDGSLHIQLQPGEEIRLVSGLRPDEWFVQREDAQSSLESSHLAITPKEAKLHGRLVLVTVAQSVQRVYYLELHSQEVQGLYGLSWRHPAPVSR